MIQLTRTGSDYTALYTGQPTSRFPIEEKPLDKRTQSRADRKTKQRQLEINKRAEEGSKQNEKKKLDG